MFIVKCEQFRFLPQGFQNNEDNIFQLIDKNL